MLEFFAHTKNHFLGIDFGTSAIKVVELSYKDQKVHLENYGLVDLNWASHADDKIGARSSSYEQKMNSALKELLFKMGVKDLNACVAIPGFSGLITIIELPEMEKDELAKAIQFEAHKYIPSSLDEVAMSWEIIEKSGESLQSEAEKRVKILLVAAPKKDIERYDRLVANCSLEVNAIELETFSITRALVGDEVGAHLIIDIGSRATNIILVENGIINVNRNLDAGGNEITSAISESLSISRQRAETFKKGERDFLNTTETPIVIPVLELIISETRRILSSYKDKNKNAQINKIILSGGTSNLKGIEEYFTKALGIKVAAGDPWKKIELTPEVKPLTDKLACSFTAAIGLALRGIEEYKRK